MFKAQGGEDDAYAATSPKNAGEYTVKVSVRATAEWKATSKTFDFAIAMKKLTATGTKEYDGNATMPATLTGVIAGETVTATIAMTSKNAGATVKEVVLAGDEAIITVTMKYAYVGAAVQSFEITGKDAGNYSLAIEDVRVDIVKADIVNFTISNADAFNEFFVGATNIPDPTTNYVEIGDGYGDRDFKWQKNNVGGAWSPALPKSMVRDNPGEWRVCIQYEDGINYNLGKTEYIGTDRQILYHNKR